MKRIYSRLRKMRVFEGIPDDKLQAISQISNLHRVDRGENLLVDEKKGGLYIVLSGCANVLRCQSAEKTFLFALESGEFFGGPPLTEPHPDCSREICGIEAFDLIEIEWATLIEHLGKHSRLSAILLEKVLAAAAEKFACLSREYSHLVRQASISEDMIQSLFTEPPKDRVRTGDH